MWENMKWHTYLERKLNNTRYLYALYRHRNNHEHVIGCLSRISYINRKQGMRIHNVLVIIIRSITLNHLKKRAFKKPTLS